jgi:hypothetical protein
MRLYRNAENGTGVPHTKRGLTMQTWFEELAADVRWRARERGKRFVLVTFDQDNPDEQCQFANNFDLEFAADLLEEVAERLRHEAQCRASRN